MESTVTTFLVIDALAAIPVRESMPPTMSSMSKRSSLADSSTLTVCAFSQ